MVDAGALGRLDVSDPRNPYGLWSAPVKALLGDVHVSGDLALVSAYDQGLFIYDVAELPGVVGVYPTPDVMIESDAHENIAWLAIGSAGLMAVDISDPRRPQLMSHVQPPGGTESIAIRWPRAYVAGSGLLTVTDISDPTSPRIGNTLQAGSASSAIVLRGDVAYVAAFDAGLFIVSIAEPDSPVLLSSIDTGRAQELWIDGHFAYVADYLNGIDVVDVRDPLSPQLAGSYESQPGLSHYVAAADGIAYLSNGDPGLAIVDARECTRLCPADTDSNFTIDSRDFIRFLNAWASGTWWADWNGDRTFDTQDVIAFQNDWVNGC
ncbi:MAG TPA: GC-type dockerin domain-anchored protein [Phycisphaerales bacterium]|nr:GC-type dockerin domain-anchored protein [Phycisphaerales bacterium]